jgi:hypothetical protein
MEIVLSEYTIAAQSRPSYIAELSDDEVMLRNYRSYNITSLYFILNVVVKFGMDQKMWCRFKDTAKRVLNEKCKMKK